MEWVKSKFQNMVMCHMKSNELMGVGICDGASSNLLYGASSNLL